MMVLVTYDVSTIDKSGRRRLRRVAKKCQDFGIRVQNSVFECDIDPTLWAQLKHLLLDIIDKDNDSLRFYFLGSNWRHKVEHHGAKESIDIYKDTLFA
jgi:CRISPR-associated protein Cas2